MDYPRVSIVEKVYHWSCVKPDYIAIYTKEKNLSYKELFNESVRFSEYLYSKGVRVGNRVVFKASQSHEFPIIYLGIHLIGGVAVSLEKSTPNEKMVSIAHSLGATFIISDDVGNIGRSCYFDQTRNSRGFSDYDHKCGSYSFPDINSAADVLFTTGTTGVSKGVELSHLALVATAENLIAGCGYNEKTMIIVPGPLNHANAIRKLFTSLYNGSAIYILSGLTDVAGFFAALKTEGVSIACCLPPAAIRAIFTLTKERIGQYKGVIDFIESASAPLPEGDKKKLHDLLPFTRLYNNYGSSESASVCMYNYADHLDLVGCIGKPTANATILIVDDDKNVIESSEKNLGYIASSGDMNMTCYVNEPKLTAEVLRGGVVYTNDLGYINKDGFVFIVGRKGDVINVGGFKVTPIEIESAALEFQGVDDCICVPVDDPITGKALKLLTVSKCRIDFKELRSFLSQKLESYKVPQYFEMVPEIARTYNGKLDRKHYLK